jgi:uncharacterized membrane protein
MILKTDFISLFCVTVVTIFVLWESRRSESSVYVIMKIIAVVVAMLWIIAAILYSQQ